jgi:DNA-binding transcriptional LysR family regulator
MEVAQLRALRELRDRGSIAAVARAWHVTPSAVSQQLAALQRSAGVPLTRLDGRRTVLTGAGAALADAAVDVEVALAHARDAVAGYLAEAGSTVSVSAFYSAGLALFPRLLTARVTGRPTIELRDDDVAQDGFPRLTADVDLVVAHRLAGGPAWPAGVVVTHLLTEPLDLAFRAGHRLDAPGTPAAAELRDVRWIGVHRDFPLADAVRVIGAAAGAEPVVVHRVNEFSIAAALLAASDLVALLPRHTSAAYRSPSLRLRALPRGLATERHIDVLARPEALQRAGVRAVLDALRRAAAELTAGSSAPR